MTKKGHTFLLDSQEHKLFGSQKPRLLGSQGPWSAPSASIALPHILGAWIIHMSHQSAMGIHFTFKGWWVKPPMEKLTGSCLEWWWPGKGTARIRKTVFFRAMPERKRFFLCEVFPNLNSCPPSLYFSNGRDRHQVADSPVAFDSDYMVRFTTN